MKKGEQAQPIVRVPAAKSAGSYEKRVVFVLLVLFLIALSVYVFQPDWLVDFGNTVYVLFAAVAVGFGVWALRVSGPSGSQGKLILLLTLAFVADVIAGGTWLVYESILGVEPFPSLADVVWVLFYLFSITGFGLVLFRLRKFIQPAQALFAMAVWGIIVAIVSTLTLSLIFSDDTYSLTAKLFSIMYPAGDLLTLLVILLLFSVLRKSVFTGSLLAFMIAFLILTIGDLIFSYQSWNGTYVTGTIVDLFWLASQLLTAYGFYLQIKAVRPS